jgi:tetratricopeptide (TPR) repeat protein
MEPETVATEEKEFLRARKELDEGNVLAALAGLEKALKINDDPRWHSCLGFCIAKERGHVTRGLELCRSALERDPDTVEHYLYLGRVYLLAGNKVEALKVLRQGMQKEANPEIAAQLAAIGNRKPPVLSALSRDNLLNKWLGYILNRLGLR